MISKITTNKATKITLAFLIVIFCSEFNVLSQVQNFNLEAAGIRKTNRSVLPSYTIQEQTDEVLKLEYDFTNFALCDITGGDKISYKIIRINGFGLSGDVGAPALPVKLEKIVIPKGKVAEVKVVSSEFTEFQDIDLYPVQEPGTDGKSSVTSFAKDAGSYSADNYQPAVLSQIVSTQVFRGVTLGFLKISPVQYNPVTRTARIYTKLNIVVEFKQDKNSFTRVRNSKGFSGTGLLQNCVINKDMLPSITVSNNMSYEIQPTGYLIATVPEFDSAAARLAQWKRQLGYYVEIVSRETWTISEVKTVVEDYYYNSDYDFEYFTIIGDQEHVPDYYYETSYGNVFLKVYSQNYYVCMDGYWDYMPEMAHGRISVYDADEALLVVDKIIGYEKNPPDDPGFYNRGLHAGYFQDSTRDGVSDYRYAKTNIEMYNYMTSLGFESDLVLYTEPDVVPESFNAYFTSQTTVPSQYLKSNGYQWDGNNNDILNAWNNGILYAFHRDHGHPDEWVRPNFTVDDMNSLNNGNELPIVLSINCGTGLFTNPEPFVCFSEKLLRHPEGGAVGIVSATAETISGYNDAFIIGMMDAIWPNPGLIPDMGDGTDTAIVQPHQPIYSMGDVMIQGLIRMTETWDPIGWADRNQFHLYHYFGDPAMKIWTEPPVQLTAEHEAILPEGSSSIHVWDINCNDAIITICQGSNLWKTTCLFSGSGTIDLPEPVSGSMGEITLTISKHNHIPYVVSIPVIQYPDVDFQAEDTDICPSDTVEFTDLTLNDPDNWYWEISPSTFEFILSTTESSQNPVISFFNEGTYSVSLTAANLAGQESTFKEDYIVVKPKPQAPAIENQEKCFPDDIPPLYAEGANIRWYSDNEKTILLFEGNEYIPENVSVGENYFYASQTVDECMSDLTMATITEFPMTPLPWVDSATICEFDTARVIAQGHLIRWYSDSLGANLELENDTLVVFDLEPGEHIYYATATENSCESEFVSSVITVNAQPMMPEVSDRESCFGDSIILSAVGENIIWYSDIEAPDALLTGNDYDLGKPDVGEYYYYLTQTVLDCESERHEVQLLVHELPVFILGEDETIHLGDTLIIESPLSGQYLWFDGSTMNTLQFLSTEYGTGNYDCWLQVTSDYNCSYTDSLIIEVLERNPGSVINKEVNSDLKLYPNPSSGVINLEMIRRADIPFDLYISDIQGRILFSGNFTDYKNEIDLSGLPAGMYQMTITSHNISRTLRLILE